MSKEGEEEEYEGVEPADDEEPADEDEEGGLPAWLFIALGLPLFCFMTWCGYIMAQ